MNEDIKKIVEKGLKCIQAKAPECKVYEDYYNGDHDLSFATDKYRNAFGKLFMAFADNLCESVVDAVADRLEVKGFGLQRGKPGATEPVGEDVTEDAMAIWQDNRMDEMSGEVHQEGIKQGNAYVIVWPDPEDERRPLLYANDAALIHVEYNKETKKVEWAMKSWLDEDDHKTYVNLYFVDRIEKYVTRSAAVETATNLTFESFIHREVEGEDWPLPNPYNQVPVFQFRSNAPPGKCGRSELRNVIPLQRGLNKSLTDMLVAMEFVALPQRWVTGLEIPTDPATGLPIPPFKPGADRIFATESTEVRFGEFNPANLGQFLAVQDRFQYDICRVSRTPLTYMMLLLNPPSGTALAALEAGFIKKCKDRTTSFGNTWEDVLKFAIRISRGIFEPQQGWLLNVQWADIEQTSELERSQTAVSDQAAGISKEQTWRHHYGMSDQEVEQNKAEVMDAEKAKAEVGAMMLAKFNTGGGTTP